MVKLVSFFLHLSDGENSKVFSSVCDLLERGFIMKPSRRLEWKMSSLAPGQKRDRDITGTARIFKSIIIFFRKVHI